ncbi:hypothetical protein E4U42_000038 [Claviceps africana]|uniref:Xylanolytic transcriptional activator regulatory domain-containing protein n=1 Tax=Claviceps africana TaxID=83212 RepID=A0A8K0JD19_9HYPO|nr:hypothetical protein E4U42_000038 [Claviceps africana]
MAQNPPVQRTAPIAIAPKPSRRAPTPPRQESVSRLEIGPSISQTVASIETTSLAASTIPCESCRSSTTKCVLDDDQDSCTACQASGSDCSFLSGALASPHSRKRKMNGLPHCEDSPSKRSSPNLSSRKLGNSSLSSTVASSFLEEMANVGGPTMLKRTLGMQHDRFSQYIGLTTDFEPSLIDLSTFDPQDESLLARGTLRKVSDNDTFLMLPDSSTPGHDHIVQDVDAIEAVVSPHGRKLVDLYFRIVHPSFPIIQKDVFLEKYERSPREFSPPILAAVYLLAINWWDHWPELACLPRPNFQELERLIRGTLADAMHRPKLSTIQAGLLLSQRPDGDQWAPTAQLVAIGQELGLHLDCTNWKIPPWEKGLRRRLSWALYMQDKWGALIHGRPSHIFTTNWGVRALTANDFPDMDGDEEDEDQRQDVEKGRMLFSWFVKLSEILSEILEIFYSLNSTQTIADAGPHSTQLVLSLAKPVQLKLKEWYSALPAGIRLESYSMASYAPASPPATDRLSSIGYLHLGYFATEITLHRRIIRSLASTSNAVDPYVEYICRSAAKARLISAMDFVNRLTPNHLRSFWFFASKTNFALIGTFGSLLWATSPGREEADWYRRRLEEYRWTLLVSSKPGESGGLTRFAMTMLDISTGLLKRLPEKPPMSRSESMADMSAPLSFPRSFSGGSLLDQFSNIHSPDVSSVQSPISEDSSSDDDLDDNFSTPI